MNDYEQQAIDFLASIQAKIVFRYIGHNDSWNDGNDHAVWKVTLTDYEGRFESFDFTESLVDSYYYRPAGAFGKKTAIPQGARVNLWRPGAKFNYRTKAGRTASYQTQGTLHANTNKPPSAYSVLACLTKYDPGTFSDFCGDFGYDEDSTSARETYFAVQKEWEKVRKIFSGNLEKLQEIE